MSLSLAIKLILVAGLLFECKVFSRPPADEMPTPYEFAFQEQNANHTLAQQESGDDQVVVRGQYTITDSNGQQQTVKYVADKDGLRANIPVGANIVVGGIRITGLP